MNICLRLLGMCMLGGLLLTSCKRDMFDPEAYRNLILETAPVGHIDEGHDWNLTQSHTLRITADVPGVTDVQAVRILDGNPYEAEDVEILAEQPLSNGQQATLFFYAPTWLTTFYAAVVDSDDRHYLVPVADSQTDVSFSGSELVMPADNFNAPVYQTYTYLFEEDYPKPSGDWDFNDLVLRIQKLPAKEDNEIRLCVTLAAVGGQKQMAAAVRLTPYSFSDVESVTIEEGRTFDGYSEPYVQNRQLITHGDLLLEGEHGEAVLNLFEDAHWVMSPRLRPDGGGTVRMYYNTYLQVDENISAQLSPKQLTYVVKLRNPKNLSTFTLEDLDPFMIEDFNSGKWEVHTAPFKAAGVLRDYGANETATCNNIVWALKIPYAAFRWPIEGTSLGFYREGVLTGAYMKNGHSFGQWADNRHACLDWFRHPTTELVY